MTNLEQFLNKNKDIKTMEPASGSFACQDLDCDEIVFDGFIDRKSGRLQWICSNGHDSSVVI